METVSQSASLASQISRARNRGVPLIAIQTSDPFETLATVSSVSMKSEALPSPCVVWDIISGTRDANDLARKSGLASSLNKEASAGEDVTVGDPRQFLRRLADGQLHSQQYCAVMHLAARFLGDPEVIQGILNLRNAFKARLCSLVLLSPLFKLPPELAGDILVLDDPLPSRERLERIAVDCLQDAEQKAGSEVIAKLADATSGLSAFAAEQTVALSIGAKGIDTDSAWERKRRQIEQTPGLSVWRGGETFADIGGLSQIKDYLGKILRGNSPPRAILYLEEIEKAMAGAHGDTSGVSQDYLGTLLAHMQDTDAAGMILVGQSGTGKSQVAKAAGAEVGIPTCRLDLSACKDSLVGVSEARLRDALRTIDAISEKRCLWLASCNSIGALPPELRRRFTLGVFMLDIPTADERLPIWKIWLAKRGITKHPKHGELLAASNGWTGAEVKQCCDVMYRTGLDFEAARGYVVPLSVSAADSIQALRRSASGKFLSASRPGVYIYREGESALDAVPGMSGPGEVSVNRPRRRIAATTE